MALNILGWLAENVFDFCLLLSLVELEYRLTFPLMPNSCYFALFQLKLNGASPDALPMWSRMRCH